MHFNRTPLYYWHQKYLQDDEINPQKRKRSPETKEHRNPREYEPDEEFEMSEPMFMPGGHLMTFGKPHKDKTLIDSDISIIHTNIISKIEKRFNTKLR